MTTRPLENAYRENIHKSKYARWVDELGRREEWDETVSRYVNYVCDKAHQITGQSIDSKVKESIYNAIYWCDVMPSMRALMTAGPALDRDNVAGFNCSYVAADHPVVFDEILYILTCGTGVGFSVERQFVNKLPAVGADNSYMYKMLEPSAFPECPEDEIATYDSERNCVVVPDSKIGWASALRTLLVHLWNGNLSIDWDVSLVRPAGSRLKTFGGRASGAGPLEELFYVCKNVFTAAMGKKLTSLQAHDLICKIADIVVVGGVRRSALISLSNLSDSRMRDCKTGKELEMNDHRYLANNSACYTEKPDMNIFIKEWMSLYNSGSGERGIFNREAAQNKVRTIGRRDPNHDFGTNPCAEIILRSKEFCNLSEVVVREDDTFKDLQRKVKIATIIGTIQSLFTDFRYLRPEWKINCEEERLLGVSMTGIYDNPVMCNLKNADFEFKSKGLGNLAVILSSLKNTAIHTNEHWADYFSIKQAAAITCVKPSGTVSQLVNSASGIHPRHAQYYIRRITADNNDPLTNFLKEVGIPNEPKHKKEETTTIFSFPIKGPKKGVFKHNIGAIEHLELWKIYAQYWCEHKPSATISIREEEWLEVAAYVYKNFDYMSGVSFLPYFEASTDYKQLPFETCDEKTYKELAAKMPANIDWKQLAKYEKEDHTKGSQELACVAGQCEI